MFQTRKLFKGIKGKCVICFLVGLVWVVWYCFLVGLVWVVWYCFLVGLVWGVWYCFLVGLVWVVWYCFLVGLVWVVWYCFLVGLVWVVWYCFLVWVVWYCWKCVQYLVSIYCTLYISIDQSTDLIRVLSSSLFNSTYIMNIAFTSQDKQKVSMHTIMRGPSKRVLNTIELRSR